MTPANTAISIPPAHRRRRVSRDRIYEQIGIRIDLRYGFLPDGCRDHIVERYEHCDECVRLGRRAVRSRPHHHCDERCEEEQ